MFVKKKIHLRDAAAIINESMPGKAIYYNNDLQQSGLDTLLTPSDLAEIGREGGREGEGGRVGGR